MTVGDDGFPDTEGLDGTPLARPLTAATSDGPAPVRRLAVLGCGLIGGSFALALRAAGLAQHIVGCGRSLASLDGAVRLGVIDEAVESPAHAVAGADLVLIAVPLSEMETVMRGMLPALGAGALVMDVGSTKRDVVDVARRVLRDRIAQFVPAHPIAGGERAGVQHADARLFERRQVILTPAPDAPAALVGRAHALWRALGAQVLQMSPEHHDEAFAAVSHLPHLLSFAYVASLINQPAGPAYLALAGPGFRDFTRIAAGDPEVWRDILMANREEVLKQLQRFRYALDGFDRAVRAGDRRALEQQIVDASAVRAGWSLAGDAMGLAMARRDAGPPTALAPPDSVRDTVRDSVHDAAAPCADPSRPTDTR